MTIKTWRKTLISGRNGNQLEWIQRNCEISYKVATDCRPKFREEQKEQTLTQV